MKTLNKSRLVAFLIGIWVFCVVLIVIGFAWYDVRQTTLLPAPPLMLPTKAQIITTPPKQKPVVAMFLHPRCPCSRASLKEFSNVVRNLSSDADFRVIFFKPASQNLDWVRCDNLFATASTMKNVTVSIDEDGKEAERFGAETSGFVVAYDAHGSLLFSGGITGARGHEGKNAGEEFLQNMVRRARQREMPTVQPAQSPVFGCAILANPLNTMRRAQYLPTQPNRN